MIERVFCVLKICWHKTCSWYFAYWVYKFVARYRTACYDTKQCFGWICLKFTRNSQVCEFTPNCKLDCIKKLPMHDWNVWTLVFSHRYPSTNRFVSLSFVCDWPSFGLVLLPRCWQAIMPCWLCRSFGLVLVPFGLVLWSWGSQALAFLASLQNFWIGFAVLTFWDRRKGSA